MKQPHKRTALLFITLSMVAVLLLLIDMATGDTYIPISKVWAVLTLSLIHISEPSADANGIPESIGGSLPAGS